MIKNEKQYGVTKNNLKKFQDAIKVISESSSSKNPLLLKLQIDSIQSEIDIFEEEIKKQAKVLDDRKQIEGPE